jgi:winged helix DNA-binding protein
VRPLHPARLARQRAATQLLHRPVSASDPVAIAREIGGAQAQDVYAGPQQFRSRSRRLTAEDVRRARVEERSLLRTWVMRMTVHLIPTEDAAWWLPLFEPDIARWQRRRLGELGLPERDVERALKAIGKALGDEGPMTRTEARERVKRAGVGLNSQTGLHIVGLAVTSGLACLGPDQGSQTCLVRRDDWLGRLPPVDRDRAIAELARVYIHAFAPATDRDFAYWSGLGLREVRAGLEAISSELEEVRVADQAMLAPRRGLQPLPRTGQVRMLGNFDTYLLGWKDRSFSTSGEHALHVKAGGGGWIRPVIVEDGVVVGGWRSSRKRGGIEVQLNLPKGELGRLRPKIEAEIADLERFEAVEATIL